MAKYDPLEAYLARRGEQELELGFAEIERLVGSDLSPSASRPQWWANEVAADLNIDTKAKKEIGVKEDQDDQNTESFKQPGCDLENVSIRVFELPFQKSAHSIINGKPQAQ